MAPGEPFYVRQGETNVEWRARLESLVLSGNQRTWVPQDLTGATISLDAWEVDGDGQFTISGADVTIPAQTGDDLGVVSFSVDYDTLGIHEGQLGRYRALIHVVAFDGSEDYWPKGVDGRCRGSIYLDAFVGNHPDIVTAS